MTGTRCSTGSRVRFPPDASGPPMRSGPRSGCCSRTTSSPASRCRSTAGIGSPPPDSMATRRVADRRRVPRPRRPVPLRPRGRAQPRARAARQASRRAAPVRLRPHVRRCARGGRRSSAACCARRHTGSSSAASRAWLPLTRSPQRCSTCIRACRERVGPSDVVVTLCRAMVAIDGGYTAHPDPSARPCRGRRRGSPARDRTDA